MPDENETVLNGEESLSSATVTTDDIRHLHNVSLHPNTKFTPELKEKFLQEYAETGNITISAKKTGIGLRTVYDHIETDEKFKEDLNLVKEILADKAEAELDLRVYKGTPKDVYYQGLKAGTVYEKSDRLLEFKLKGLRPDKYRERHEITGKDGGALVFNLVSFKDLPDQEEITVSPESSDEVDAHVDDPEDGGWRRED